VPPDQSWTPQAKPRHENYRASFIRRQTLAREMLCFFATCVSDMPERRSITICSRLTLSRDLPIWRPSRAARRRAARLCEKAEAKLDVLLQSSLAASEKNDVVESRNSSEVSPRYDVYISHATEYKPYVEPLVKALEAAGIKVWFDKTALEWGDDLRPSIDRGLANCRYGIVILSKAFLRKKKWHR
jgi:TIR domain-containing protein